MPFLDTRVKLDNPSIEGLSPEMRSRLTGLTVKTSDPSVLTGAAIVEAVKTQCLSSNFAEQIRPLLEGKIFIGLEGVKVIEA